MEKSPLSNWSAPFYDSTRGGVQASGILGGVGGALLGMLMLNWSGNSLFSVPGALIMGVLTFSGAALSAMADHGLADTFNPRKPDGPDYAASRERLKNIEAQYAAKEKQKEAISPEVLAQAREGHSIPMPSVDINTESDLLLPTLPAKKPSGKVKAPKAPENAGEIQI